MRPSVSVILLGLDLACVSLFAPGVFAQGMATPERKAAPPPKLKSGVQPPRVRFEDIAAAAGLNARHVSGSVSEKKYILETTGSGIAFIDYDNDGWPDIFLVNGTTLDRFPKGQEPTNHLYHNNRDGTFTDVTQTANLARSGWGQGVCVGDFDNDGYDDIFVTYYGQNVLYRNTGKGKFVDITEKAGLVQKTPGWSTGCAFVDYDRDGKLDLFVSRYVNFDPASTPQKGSNRYCMWKGMPVVCGPRGLQAGTNLLYHNNGDGTFTDVSEKSGIASVTGRYSFSPLVADFDNDGWPDIYVACDSTPSILYHNQGNGTFTDIGIMSGAALNDNGLEQAGMGVAATDYDHDGFIDIVKTNFEGDVPNLYRNNRDGTFTDVTYQAGLGSTTRFLGWGVCFLDFDNDGRKDIFIANGHVYPEVDTMTTDSRYKQQRLVYWNAGDGNFLNVSSQAGAGILEARCSRGLAAGDIDNDGSLKVVINNMNDSPSLLKNLGEKKNWLLIKTIGTKSNRDGIGARVSVVAAGTRQMDEVRSGGSYMSQNDLRLHFGLGDATRVERIEVSWPSGRNEVFENIKANQVVILEEGKGNSAGKPDHSAK